MIVIVNSFKFILISIVVVLLGISSGCSKERFNESVYEGLKNREEIKRCPNEPSRMEEPMTYDQYMIEKEKIKEQ